MNDYNINNGNEIENKLKSNINVENEEDNQGHIELSNSRSISPFRWCYFVSKQWYTVKLYSDIRYNYTRAYDEFKFEKITKKLIRIHQSISHVIIE
jgi:hypothetical protein